MPHKDGWGIAWYDECEIRLVKESRPAAESACVRFIQETQFTTPFAISHVRRANRGAVALRNCQPFVCEMGGTWHAFAHNGDLAGIDAAMPAHLDGFRTIGETDSEIAFCALLERLRPLRPGKEWPSFGFRREVVDGLAAELRELGPANFLYGDGDALFAHGDGPPSRRRHDPSAGSVAAAQALPHRWRSGIRWLAHRGTWRRAGRGHFRQRTADC